MLKHSIYCYYIPNYSNYSKFDFITKTQTLKPQKKRSQEIKEKKLVRGWRQ